MSAKPVLFLPPPAALGEPVPAAILAALPEARVVGGAVRDLLAGLRLGDLDIATPEPPEEVTLALARVGLKARPTGLAHGTVSVSCPERVIEITTLRRDLATDGRRAKVGFGANWEEDAARRDITINALSLRRDGAVFDSVGGIADLAAGRVRFVGDPARRMAEDYLRILRFFRFQALFGTKAPQEATLAAIAASVPGLAKLSAERVWNELKRLLAAPDPLPALRGMEETGVLAFLLPGARAERLTGLGFAPADPLLRFAALLGWEAAEAAKRLRLSGAEQAMLAALLTKKVPAEGARDTDLRRMLAEEDRVVLLGRVWLAGGKGTAGELRARLGALPCPRFPLAGRDALALGLASGPEVGAALAAVRAWWLAGGGSADAAACRSELARLLKAD